MRINLKRSATGAGALALVSGLMLASSGAAFATTTAVGWEPDAHSIGSITLLDANGVPITGGSLNDSPLAAYAVASHPGRTGDTKASLYAYTPQAGVDPVAWTGEPLSAGTFSPEPSGTPSDLSTTLPFVTGEPGDEGMAGYISDVPNQSTAAGYQNLYELREYTSGAGQPADNTQYDTLDISVNTTNSTWQVVYPSAANSPYPDSADTTTTTLTTSPSSPDSTSASPVSVTLNASVAAATAVPSSYTGPIGTVSFFDGSTAVGTPQLVTGSGPYTASVTDSLPNPSSVTYTAKFAPYIGTGLTTSNGAVSFAVSVPAPATTTTVTATPGAFAGDTNTYDAKVDLTAGGAACAGKVVFTDGSTPIGTATSLKAGTTDVYEVTNTFNSPGTHTITGSFTPTTPSQCAPSQGSAAPFTQAANPNGPCSAANGGSCTDPQGITATIPQGALTISTPYTATNPLDLGTMAPNSSDTQFTASATFGKSATDPTQDILITDTRAGDLPWTAQAQASTLSDGGTNVGSQISGENVGLTGLTVLPVAGNSFNTASTNFTTFANAAASPAVGPTDTGTMGLGNAAHDIAQAKQGFGSVGLVGTLTLNAPSSTEAGTFTGTVTFTLVGSLV